MRFMFNAFKKIYWACDRLWIYTTGRRVSCYAAITADYTIRYDATTSSVHHEKTARRYNPTPLYFYGLHQTIRNDNNCNVFGIDCPDDMVLEITYREHKPIPSIGDHICFDDESMGKWEVISRSLTQHRYLGRGRLELICSRYQENITSKQESQKSELHHEQTN